MHTTRIIIALSEVFEVAWPPHLPGGHVVRCDELVISDEGDQGRVHDRPTVGCLVPPKTTTKKQGISFVWPAEINE